MRLALQALSGRSQAHRMVLGHPGLFQQQILADRGTHAHGVPGLDQTRARRAARRHKLPRRGLSSSVTASTLIHASNGPPVT
jgi:hypothetical protein